MTVMAGKTAVRTESCLELDKLLVDDSVLYEDGRDVAVVDLDDLPLGVDLKPLLERSCEPLTMTVLLEIKKIHGKFVRVSATDVNSDLHLEANIKLPSLAIVDPQAAQAFAQNAAKKLRLRRQKNGDLELKIV